MKCTLVRWIIRNQNMQATGFCYCVSQIINWSSFSVKTIYPMLTMLKVGYRKKNQTKQKSDFALDVELL